MHPLDNEILSNHQRYKDSGHSTEARDALMESLLKMGRRFTYRDPESMYYLSEDDVQDLMVVLINKLPSLDDHINLPAHFFVCARFKHMARYKSKYLDNDRYVYLDEDILDEDLDATRLDLTASPSVTSHQMAECLCDLQNLDREYHQIVILRMQGFSYKDISDMLELPYNRIDQVLWTLKHVKGQTCRRFAGRKKEKSV